MADAEGDRFAALLSHRASAAQIDMPEAMAHLLRKYFGLLAHWNRRINLTALPLDEPTAAAVDRLLIEPLVAAERLLLDAANWVDLGSGGGSPAIPMKLARPGAKLTMVESRSRKAAFLREAIRELALEGATVSEERFENLSLPQGSLAGGVDLVTARAVRTDRVLFESAAALLKAGGELALFRSTTDSEAADSRETDERFFQNAGLHALLPGSSLQVFRRTSVPRGTNGLT